MVRNILRIVYVYELVTLNSHLPDHLIKITWRFEAYMHCMRHDTNGSAQLFILRAVTCLNDVQRV